MTLDDFLDTKRIAKLLKIHKITAQRLCREGKIPAVKFHGTWLVNINTLKLFKGTYIPYPGKNRKSVNKLF